MFSQAQRAQMRALLDDARNNSVPDNDSLFRMLGQELFSEYEARWSRIYEAEEQEVDAVVVCPSVSLDLFRDKVNNLRRQHGQMSNRLPKLLEQADDLSRRIMSHQKFLARAKPDAWAAYEALTVGDRDWFAPGTEEAGWPPKLFDQAPDKAKFASLGRQTPMARALVRVLERALEEQ